MSAFKKENIPNFISVFRIILVPLYVLLFFGIIPWGTPLISSGIVFIIAGTSDLLDGFLARKNQWITDVGKLLDPLADKLLELAVNLCLAVRFGNFFIILAAITVIKEGVMIIGAFIILRHGKFTVSSVWYGKAATFAWFIVVIIMSFIPSAASWGQYLCVALIGFMTFAFVMYTIHFKDAIIKTWKELHKGSQASMDEAKESK